MIQRGTYQDATGEVVSLGAVVEGAVSLRAVAKEAVSLRRLDDSMALGHLGLSLSIDRLEGGGSTDG